MYIMKPCDSIWVWIFLFIFNFISKVESDCSLSCDNYHCPCECYKNEVQCSNRSITEILRFPGHIQAQVLDLDNNFITELESKDFNQKYIKNLVGLRLSSNKIKRIRANTFESLHQLETLFLNHNYIDEISENAFVGLEDLRRLYLNNNQIKSLPTKVFKSLQFNLKLLYLQGNKIDHITPDLLINFRQLTTIDLSKNKLTKLDGRFLTKMQNIQHVFLQNNPWSCDKGTVCSTIGAIERIRQSHPTFEQRLRSRHSNHRLKKSLTIHGGMVCASPIQYMGLMAKSLLKIFKCHQIDLTQYFMTVTISEEQRKFPNRMNETDNDGGENSSNKNKLSYYVIISILLIRIIFFSI
ncbi:uncharacterized protein LOC120346415 [Styela clava]